MSNIERARQNALLVCDLCHNEQYAASMFYGPCSVLDFSRPCCTARYIARLKSLEQRKGWLARFSSRKDSAFMAQVEARLTEMWHERKAARHPG